MKTIKVNFYLTKYLQNAYSRLPLHLQKYVNIYILSLLFMFIYGCSQQNPSKHTLSCTLVDQKCTIKGNVSETLVEFLATPEVEELISVKIDLPAGQKFIKGYVEGTNMNMGKSPFMVTNEADNVVIGDIFLGSCNQSSMQWQLTVLTMAENGKNKKQDALIQRVLFNTEQTN